MTEDERIKEALRFAWSFGQIKGDPHKTWVIDQMVRALLGEDQYKSWVMAYETTDGDKYWTWEVGVKPNI